MKNRLKLLIALVVAVPIGSAGWYAWLAYTTPALPVVAVNPADKVLVALVESAQEKVRESPRSGTAWGNLALVLGANEFPAESMECFAHAERFDPLDPRWPYFRARMLRGPKPQQAMHLFRKARTVAKAPHQQATISLRLALILIEEGELDEAEDCLNALRVIEVDHPKVRLGFGLLAVARKDWEGARKHLSALLEVPFARKLACAQLAIDPELDDKSSRYYYALATRLPPDVPWFDSIVAEMDRYEVSRRSQLGRVQGLIGQGQFLAARELAEQLLAESEDAEVLAVLAQALVYLNDLEAAERTLRRLLLLDTGNVGAHYHLGLVYFRQGEKKEPAAAREFFQQAVSAQNRVLAIQPEHADAHLLRGRALKFLGRTDESIRALRQSLLCRPNSSAAMHQMLGEMLAEAGQFGEALEHLENATRLAGPDDLAPREALEKWRTKAKGSP